MNKAAVCKDCGKEFTYEWAGGRLRQFCSTKCSNHWRNTHYSLDYWKNRAATDADWKKKRLEYNKQLSKRLRIERKAEAFERLVEDLLNAESEEAFRIILEERVRLKSSAYWYPDKD